MLIVFSEGRAWPSAAEQAFSDLVIRADKDGGYTVLRERDAEKPTPYRINRWSYIRKISQAL
jgi:hypothetical protein